MLHKQISKTATDVELVKRCRQARVPTYFLHTCGFGSETFLLLKNEGILFMDLNKIESVRCKLYEHLGDNNNNHKCKT